MPVGMFRWLQHHIPRVISDASPQGFDEAYIDATNLFVEYLHPKRHRHEEHVGKDYHTCWESVVHEVVSHIEQLLQTWTPNTNATVLVAIDGVSPQSSLPRLRSERFQFDKRRRDIHRVEQHLREQLSLPQRQTPSVFDTNTSYDPNFVTPGSPFFALVSEKLRCWAAEISEKRLLKVMISDSYDAGEALYKIGQYLRLNCCSLSQESKRRILYTSNTEAILQILGTDTVVSDITLVRECLAGEREWNSYCQRRITDTNPKTPRYLCAPSYNHTVYSLLSHDAPVNGFAVTSCPSDWNPPHYAQEQNFLSISARSLKWEVAKLLAYNVSESSLEDNVDSYAADFVLLCCLCGNRFLPGIECGNLNLGDLEAMIDDYKSVARDWEAEYDSHTRHAYPLSPQSPDEKRFKLYSGDKLQHTALAQLLLRLAEREQTVSAERVKAAGQLERVQESWLGLQRSPNKFIDDVNSTWASIPEHHRKTAMQLFCSSDRPLELMQHFERLDDLMLRRASQVVNHGACEKLVQTRDVICNSPVSRFRLYRLRFDLKGFMPDISTLNTIGSTVSSFNPTSERVIREICKAYIRGLIWTFDYFYNNRIVSWYWSYNYQYTPFVSDIAYYLYHHRDQTELIQFLEGSPTDPLTAALAVTPPASAHVLPPSVLSIFSQPGMLEFNTTLWRVDMQCSASLFQSAVRFPRIPRMVERVKDACSSLAISDEPRKSQLRNVFVAFPPS